MMNIKEELLKEHSKAQTLRITAWIGTNTKRMDAFMHAFFSDDPLITQRAAWVIGTVGEEHPPLLTPYLKKLIAKMKEPGVHDAVKRNTVRALATMEIPRSLLGTVITYCFDLLASPEESIAVKVHSMTVLAQACRQEPDLGKELRLVIEQQLPLAGPAFRARARKILKIVPQLSQ